MKKFLLFIIIFVLIGGSLFAQFYEHFNMSFRRELAEAYYLVGKQYQSIGKKEKGGDFIDMAFNIYPELNPKSIDPNKRIIRSRQKWPWKPSVTALGRVRDASLQLHEHILVRPRAARLPHLLLGRQS